MDTAEKIILFCFLLQGVCCRDFNITLPQKIEALNGSCVIIKCRFEIREIFDKDLTERATGLWLKDGINVNNNLVFNSSTSSQKSFMKGNITGKLKDKDCTTVFHDFRSDHSGQYYFRIEGEGELKWTYTETSASIHVVDSPPRPTVQLYVEQKEVQDQEEVLEGRSVSLRCSAETLCSSPPPTLTWSSTPRIPLSESSRLEELISDLNFTATHRQHRVTFTCTITYQLQDETKTAQDNITLHVQYAPKISPSSSCTRTDVTVCFCEADGNPSPELEWHLSGRPVTNSSNTFISEERLSSTGLRSSITLHQSLTHTSTLQCVSNNTHGNASQLFQLPSSVARLNLFSVMTGVVVGLVVMLLCAITCICVRLFHRRIKTTLFMS
uniref:Ig-like domain-containing protein n=1 Tax=Cyprinus carpio carpio TaxID=630221 RepID=A0A8C0YCD7_CYPCA